MGAWHLARRAKLERLSANAGLADAGLFGLASDAKSDQLASPGWVNAQVRSPIEPVGDEPSGLSAHEELHVSQGSWPFHRLRIESNMRRCIRKCRLHRGVAGPAPSGQIIRYHADGRFRRALRPSGFGVLRDYAQIRNTVTRSA